MSFVIEHHDEKVDSRPSNEFFEHEAHFCFNIEWTKFTATDRKRTRVDNAHMNSLAVVYCSIIRPVSTPYVGQIVWKLKPSIIYSAAKNIRRVAGDIKALKTSVVKNDVESNCDFKELLLDERGAGVD